MTRPFPPSNLPSRSPRIETIARGQTIYRFFNSSKAPIYFDRSKEGRLNSPNGLYGVLYAAVEVHGAFAESFLRQPDRQIIPMDLVQAKALVRLTATRDLTLCALAGRGLAKVGATAEVTHGGQPYDCPQSWSSAIHSLPTAFDGIFYKARHDDDQGCYALFDRSADGVSELDRDIALDSDWFWNIAADYDVGLAP